jgi:UDPglucose 6-dehydrogenase
VRDSPALPLIRRLESEGATCRVWDPMASEQAAGHRRFSPEEALRGADAALLVTSWPEIAGWPWDDLLAGLRRRVIVYARGLLRSHRWPEDVRYVPIGRGPVGEMIRAT